MRIAVLAVGVLMSAARAAAGPYDAAPLAKSDVDLYVSVMKQAADHVSHATGADKDAIAYMRKYHGNPPAAQPPNFDMSNASDPKQAAAMMKAMQEYSKKAELTSAILARATTLSQYDEEVAKQRHVQAHYDDVKAIIVSLVGTGAAAASCGGSDCGGPMTKAQIEAGKKWDAARAMDKKTLAPYAAQIEALQHQLSDFFYGR